MSGPQTADQLAYVAEVIADLGRMPDDTSGRRRSMSDVIGASLREGILNGHIPAGTWLNEELLARALGVSRTPVREALRKIDGENLTARGPGNTRIVAAPSADDVVAMYQVREFLEGLAARLLAARPNIEVVDALSEITRQMIQARDDGDVALVTRLNRHFHSTLWEATGNSYLVRLLIEVRSSISRFGRSPFEEPDVADRYIKDKIDVTRAIATMNCDEAERISRRHTVDAMAQRLRLLYSPHGEPTQQTYSRPTQRDGRV